MTEQTKLLTCPFCKSELFYDSVGRWAEHPKTSCYLSEYEFDDFSPEVWNTRATPTGTIITENESTWPADGQVVALRWGKELMFVKWDGWYSESTQTTLSWLQGCVWGPTDNLFNVPRGK